MPVARPPKTKVVQARIPTCSLFRVNTKLKLFEDHVPVFGADAVGPDINTLERGSIR